MKHIIGVLCASLALCASMLTGCGASSDTAQVANKIEVVCTTFPSYDWAREIVGDAGDKIDLSLLIDDGTDLHSYQPSVEDMAKLADADLLVYVGGESDSWIKDAIASGGNTEQHHLNMLEVLGDSVREEEIVEGMQAERDHEADHDHANPEEVEYDEHVWLSLRCASDLVDSLAAELGALDAEHASTFSANASAYKEKLSQLDERYVSAVAAAPKKTLLFGDRFPFVYLTSDYGLSYYAAFAGCSAETEASFETVAKLADRIDELGLTCVLTIENSDQRIAQTIIGNTKDKNQKILVMDSLQSTTRQDIDAGKTYLGTMEDNLSVLQTALA
ncbi:MAG: metal ABC transporter substrate-binding protein [Coriobacteriales bacterium]|nr:metal ABC transporter substrate-binding protein [Coriobacteriales bacterium]